MTDDPAFDCQRSIQDEDSKETLDFDSTRRVWTEQEIDAHTAKIKRGKDLLERLRDKWINFVWEYSQKIELLIKLKTGL